MLDEESLANLQEFARKVTLALRNADDAVRSGTFLFDLNYAVKRGDLGPEYLRRSQAWFSGAVDHLALLMRTKISQLDDARYEEAICEWEEAQETVESDQDMPLEEDFCFVDYPSFKVGTLGSVWVDLELCGEVDGGKLTKKTRVTLDPRAQTPPYKIVLDATFDEHF